MDTDMVVLLLGVLISFPAILVLATILMSREPTKGFLQRHHGLVGGVLAGFWLAVFVSRAVRGPSLDEMIAPALGVFVGLGCAVADARRSDQPTRS